MQSLRASLRWSAAFLLLCVSFSRSEEPGKTSYNQLVDEAGRSGAPSSVPPRPGPGKPVELPGPSAALMASRAAAAGGGSSRIMMQGFHWESHDAGGWWGIVQSKAGEIGSAGFDLIWLPPPSDAASSEGYLPRRLDVLDSAYGSLSALKGAIGALHSAGVEVIADIVINHRVGTSGWADFTEPAWGQNAVVSGDECVDAKQCADHSSSPDSGMGYGAGRDIDHSNPAVQKDIQRWMQRLREEVGFDGWRFDFVRGFSPKYLQGYIDASRPAFAVSEVWDNLDLGNPDAHRQALCDYINEAGGKTSAFDFTTKGILQHAVSSGEYWRLKDSGGRPTGLIGWWPAQAVTFLDNHDTGASTGGSGGQNAWPFPGSEVLQGYAYILTHPGVPCVYWPHFFDWGIGDQLKTLMRLRKSAGIGSASQVDIKAAESGRYAAIIDGRLAMKIGPSDWSPGSGWQLSAFGRNYAVWTR